MRITHAVVLAAAVAAVGAAPAAARPYVPLPGDDVALVLPDEAVIVADAGSPPPAPPPQAPRSSRVVLASAARAWLTAPDGARELGEGGALSLVWLQRRGDFPTGVEVGGWFLRGDDASAYDLSIRMIGSPRLGRRAAVPFVAIGLAAGASRVVDDRKAGAAHGVAIGPSGAVGLHGFLSDTFYWRAGAGVLAAGVAAFTADVGVGVVLP